MITKLVKLSELSEAEAFLAFQEAGQVIRNGGMVAFPTETVYGLGANALDADASAKIYAAKGRPSDNPLIAHIADEEELEGIAEEIPEAARILMKAFWPGPMTLVFKKKSVVPDGTTGGLDTVAVRMPDHPVARRLIREAGVPVAAPSANISGRPSPTSARRTMEDMDGRIDMVLDGGDCRIGIESTIIDVTGPVPMILRPGYITREMLTDLLGEIAVDPVLLSDAGEDFKPKAPGQKYRHYSPKAPMTLVDGEDTEAVVGTINRLTKDAVLSGKSVGIICTTESEALYDQGIKKCIGSRKKLESVAHNLYEILREFDEIEVDLIYSEAFREDQFGNAVMNRMVKAAGHSRIQAEKAEKKILLKEQYDQVIFVGADNTKESIMAEAILKNIAHNNEAKICSRGLVVLFPEPINPKVLAILSDHGLSVEKEHSQSFDPSEVTEKTLILTSKEAHLAKVKAMLGEKCEMHTLMEFAGMSGDIPAPSGEDEKYQSCFEILDLWIKVAAQQIFENLGAPEEKQTETSEEEEKQVEAAETAENDDEALLLKKQQEEKLTEEYLQVVEKIAARREAAKVEESEYKKLYKEILEKNSKKTEEEDGDAVQS